MRTQGSFTGQCPPVSGHPMPTGKSEVDSRTELNLKVLSWIWGCSAVAPLPAVSCCSQGTVLSLLQAHLFYWDENRDD